MATTKDNSIYAHTVNLKGGATIGSPYVFGDGGIQVTRTGPTGTIEEGVQIVENSNELQPGGNDFTIEFRYRPTVLYPATHISARGDVTDMVVVGDLNSGPYFYVQTGGTPRVNLNPYTTYPLSINTWYAMAFERYGNTFTIFLDGVVAAQTTWSGTIPTLASYWTVGYSWNVAGGRYNITGAIDEYRWSNTARYQGSAYTPATRAFPL